MRTIKKIIPIEGDSVTIKFPKEYKGKKIEVITTPVTDDAKSNVPQKYDFSDIPGKLNWSGDPVAEQRLVRDEL